MIYHLANYIDGRVLVCLNVCVLLSVCMFTFGAIIGRDII